MKKKTNEELPSENELYNEQNEIGSVDGPNTFSAGSQNGVHMLKWT